MVEYDNSMSSEYDCRLKSMLHLCGYGYSFITQCGVCWVWRKNEWCPHPTLLEGKKFGGYPSL